MDIWGMDGHFSIGHQRFLIGRRGECAKDGTLSPGTEVTVRRFAGYEPPDYTVPKIEEVTAYIAQEASVVFSLPPDGKPQTPPKPSSPVWGKDGPPLAICSHCRRLTWSLREANLTCRAQLSKAEFCSGAMTPYYGEPIIQGYPIMTGSRFEQWMARNREVVQAGGFSSWWRARKAKILADRAKREAGQ